MKIIGCMIFYNERPDWLHTAITSLGKLPISHMVVVDGSYPLYPDATPTSPPEQIDAVYNACAEIDATPIVHIPTELWVGGEVEKRSFMFYLAEQHAHPYEDWYWVQDADQKLGKANNVKARLENTNLDCVDTMFVERPAPNSATATVPRFKVRNVFRAIPGLHVEQNHYTYCTPDGRYLWGNQGTDHLEPALDLTDVLIAHKTHYRDKERRIQQQLYYQQRDKSLAEMNRCHHCEEPAKYTAHFDYRLHPNGRQIIASTKNVCDYHAKVAKQEALADFGRLGINPDTKLEWKGYAHIPD